MIKNALKEAIFLFIVIGAFTLMFIVPGDLLSMVPFGICACMVFALTIALLKEYAADKER